MTASIASLPLTAITHEFFPMKGGIATFVEEMAHACHNLGQKVEVWAPQAASTTTAECRFPYPIRRIAMRGTHDFTCQMRIGREMVRHRHRMRQGIMYLPEPGPQLAMMYLQFFAACRPARLLLTFHGSEIQRYASRPVTRLFINRLIHSADRVTTLSRYTCKLLTANFPAAEGKIVVTPGAPRAGFFSRNVKPVRASDKIVVLTVGRLHPRKGQMHVLQALEHLPRQVLSRIEYWIVGRSVRDDYEAALRARVRASDLPVSFFGNIGNADLESIYDRADIFAMTSVNFGKSVEGFGLAYLEASAFGLPVIGHATGGVAEAVRHGETGLLVPPGDTVALAEAIQSLVLDSGMRQRMGTAGRTWAASHSWRNSARVLLDGIAALPQRRVRTEKELQKAP